MISVSLIYANTGDDKHEHSHTNLHLHEHEDEYHLTHLIYYCLAIVPILALSILLPNTCYSMLRRSRAEREGKLD